MTYHILGEILFALFVAGALAVLVIWATEPKQEIDEMEYLPDEDFIPKSLKKII